jgi:hypothetical protein
MLIILIFLFDPEACIRRKEQELFSRERLFFFYVALIYEGNIYFFFFNHVAEKIESEITPTVPNLLSPKIYFLSVLE